MNLTLRNKAAFLLILLSLVLLYFGLVLPVFTLKVAISLPLIGETVLHDQTQSVLESVEFLWNNDNRLVSFLILFFSVMVPVIKAVALLTVLFLHALSKRHHIYAFVALISKWSMADVFVVGVLIAFLSTASNDNITAKLETGFYYFLSYCLISILAVQVMKVQEIVLDPAN
jgi:uncharacterized paraquat-inducible protein A